MLQAMMERLQAQAAELAEDNRVKDEFLATLSHELRTPLNAILGWSRMLVRGMLDAAGTRKAVEAIDRNADAQAKLINDVLDVSRIVSGRLRLEVEHTDLAACVRSALASVRPAAEAKQITLVERLEPVRVLGDADRLQQVFWNLLSNAVKFTGQGGRVSATIRRAGEDVEVVVEDDGIGIDPAFAPHLFERFRQADASSTRHHGGIGAGLALVRHVVEAHGGTVFAQSEGRGKGATFTVRLPSVRRVTAGGAGATGPRTAAAGLR
jgi:signal transduction histidine kinase